MPVLTLLITLIVAFYSVVSQGAQTKVCIDWFAHSKLKPGSKGCEVSCDALDVDLSTFMCHENCAEFCGSKKCPESSFWKDKIKAGRPDKWLFTSEVSVEWAPEDKAKLKLILNRLPEQLRVKKLVGFYRMRKSVQIINPASEQSGSIVFYDHAFDGMFPTDEVVAHELAHVLAGSRLDAYKKAVGWHKVKGDGTWARPGGFVDSEGEDDPDEDFASSLSTYLIRPEKLKSVSPKAYEWISLNLPRFKLSEECK